MRTGRYPWVGAAVLVVGVAAVLGVGARSEPAAASQPRAEEEVPVTPVDLRSVPAHNSPVVVASPDEPRFVALASRLDNPFSCTLHVSGDGGRSWVPAQPVAKLPTGADTCYAPEIAFDSDGTLYYLFVGLHGLGNSPMGVFLTSSSDQGRSWSVPHRVLGEERYMVRMAIDRSMGAKGRMHLVWLEATTPPPLGGLPASPNPLRSAFSDDGGASFSSPVQVSDPGRRLVVAPALVIGNDHTVHVLYYDLQGDRVDYQGLEGTTWDGTWSLVISTSTDGGRSFDRGTVVDDHIAPPERVMLIYTMPPATMAADGDGHLFVAWTDARNGDWDVLLRRSVDGGHSWEAIRRLNDDAIHNGRHQYMPRLSVAAHGRIDAIFYDRRNDPDNVRNDVYYTYSTNAGVSFSPNVKVTSASSDSRKGTRYPIPSAKGLHEFGSRIALLSRDDDALAAWTDTRNNRIGVEQDVFATQIDLPRPAGAGRRPYVVGATLLGLLIVGGAWAWARQRLARSR